MQTNGDGVWPSEGINLGVTYGFKTSHAPAAIEFNGRLWLAWVDIAPVGPFDPGRHYIWLSSTDNGVDWTPANRIHIERCPVSDQGFAISPCDVTLATFDDKLWVFFSSAVGENQIWYAPIKRVPGKPGAVFAKVIPGLTVGESCAVTSGRGRQFVFGQAPSNEIWMTVRSPGKPDTWESATNLQQTPSSAVSKCKPTATVVPGSPGNAPWRVWLVERGVGTTKIWESAYQY